jgi:uncharacterized protein
VASARRLTLAGPAGAIEYVLDEPSSAPRGLAVVCHPHPLFGGTLDNKVAQTLARAFVQRGYRTVRFNLRGVGASAGQWDEGRGEVDDCLAVTHTLRRAGEPLVLAGFSFGAYIAAMAAQRLAAEPAQASEWLVLIGPSTQKQTVPPVPANTLVIHGEMDDVVPLASTLDWARPMALPVTVIPGAGHFFHGQLTLLKHLVVRSSSV